MEGIQWLQEIHEARGGNFRLGEAFAGEVAEQERSRGGFGVSEAGHRPTDETEASTSADGPASSGGVSRQFGICH